MLPLESSSQDFIVFPYLEAYFKVLTELGAATQFAIEALVNKTVQLIRAVATVVLMVTKQCIIEAVSIIAGILRVVAFLLCKKIERNEESMSVRHEPI